LLLMARLPFVPLSLLWGAYGVFGSSGILTYALLARRFPDALIGRATTAMTLTVFLATFVFQIGIGFVLDFFPATGGHYPVSAHMMVWAGLVAVQVLAAIWYLMEKRP